MASLLDILKGSREFNQNDKGLAADGARVADEYQSGISAKDQYILEQAQLAQKANDQKAIADMIAKNREYQVAKRGAERFGDRPGSDGKYQLVDPNYGDQSLDVEGGRDVVTDNLAKLQAYLLNRPRNAANSYTDNVDQGLAAKWMADRESFK